MAAGTTSRLSSTSCQTHPRSQIEEPLHAQMSSRFESGPLTPFHMDTAAEADLLALQAASSEKSVTELVNVRFVLFLVPNTVFHLAVGCVGVLLLPLVMCVALLVLLGVYFLSFAAWVVQHSASLDIQLTNAAFPSLWELTLNHRLDDLFPVRERIQILSACTTVIARLADELLLLVAHKTVIGVVYLCGLALVVGLPISILATHGAAILYETTFHETPAAYVIVHFGAWMVGVAAVLAAGMTSHYYTRTCGSATEGG